MNDDELSVNSDEQQRPVAADPGYAAGQLARAFTTSLTHADRRTRRRARERVRRWRKVLAGMSEGTLSIGSRTPVAGLPAWVTPEVVRGGFATGAASAEGPLEPYESEAARRAGVRADRQALFAHHLTHTGLRQLTERLEEGAYEAALPEETALLTVAWLVRAGDSDGALELLDTLEPFAARLRFTPRPAAARTAHDAAGDAATAHRRTVGQARATVAARGRHEAVEAMNEALAVWNPFADELLAHWLETAEGGRVLARTPSADWHRRSAALLERYRHLAAEHTRCTKHRRPKENAAILRSCLESLSGDGAGSGVLTDRQLGLLRHAVHSMVRRRGVPGTAPHRTLRDRQAADAARPTHHALAQLVARRLAALPQDTGTPDIEPLLTPVTEREAKSGGLPAGAAVPDPLRRIVRGALHAPIGTLVERGVVPSAEVLAELVPQLVAATTALAYPDPALRALMAANHRAFAGRRSLLLHNLQHQVRVEELPWVRAVAGQRSGSGHSRAQARTTLTLLAGQALTGFPATLLPNPLIGRMRDLARAADLEVPLVEELAADIFTGTFSGKFLAAARIAGELLHGTLYERYYAVDYDRIVALADRKARKDGRERARQGERPDPSGGFARLCHDRVPAAGSWSVAANGMVIEQSQILTTHNLATLVHSLGATAPSGRPELARRCFTAVCRLTAQLHGHPRPLPTVKDAAYAWRQMLFHLSLCTPPEQTAVLSWLEEATTRFPPRVAQRLAPALAGLQLVVSGGYFAADGTAENGRARRFLGWTTGGHWLLA